MQIGVEESYFEMKRVILTRLLVMSLYPLTAVIQMSHFIICVATGRWTFCLGRASWACKHKWDFLTEVNRVHRRSRRCNPFRNKEALLFSLASHPFAVSPWIPWCATTWNLSVNSLCPKIWYWTYCFYPIRICFTTFWEMWHLDFNALS